MRFRKGFWKGGVTVTLAAVLLAGTAFAEEAIIADDYTDVFSDDYSETFDAQYAFSSVSLGSTGDWALYVQQLLYIIGFQVDMDGYFGEPSVEYLKQFQSMQGIYPDGIAGPITLAALETAAFGAATTDTSAPDPVPEPSPEPVPEPAAEPAPAAAPTPSVVIPTTTLSYGDSNDQVIALQQKLMELGYLNISAPDGIFGNMTDSAVKAFQSANNIYPDGVVGPVTTSALFGTTAPAADPASAAEPTPEAEPEPAAQPETAPAAPAAVALNPDGLMVLGDSSDQVTALQQKLMDLGYLNIAAPDGIFGNLTENAVKEFQSANGIYADGAVGPVTLAAMLGTPAAAPQSEVQTAARSVLDQVGWDLYSAFKYAAALNYNYDLDIGHQTSQAAIYSIDTQMSNCVGMASTFAWLARALGYNAYVVGGQVPYRNGGYGEHAWVEIVVDGKTYVCDPQFENETKKNGYMINYGDSGTWVYVYGNVLSD